ncbi:MAG TPA: DUF1573 domain-containing protein [Fimbriimonas sp.]
MLPALSLLLVVGQALPTNVLPAGASPEFIRNLQAISRAADAKDYAKAQRLLALLPKEKMVYSWDDSKVREEDRESFTRARDVAFRDWQAQFGHIQFVKGQNPDVKFSFEPELAPDPQTGLPAGLAVFYSQSTLKPRIEAVIGLRRGKPIKETKAVEVANEVRYVVASFLGLSPSPMFGPASSRTDQSTNFVTLVSGAEVDIASSVSGYVAGLKERLEKKQPIVLRQAKAFTDTTAIDLGTVSQGDVIGASIQLTNNGDGPLTYTVLPDCGCIRASAPGTIPPGATKLIRSDFDSTEFTGDVHKRLIVYTNDPEKSSFVIPVKAKILPAYRFIRPEGDVLVASGRQSQATVYLVVREGADIVPTEHRFTGLRGTAKMEEWSGVLADPEMGEGPMPRKGYKFTIDFNDAVPMGRAGTTLNVSTANERFSLLTYNLYLQKGIVALPIRLYFGQVGKEPKRATCIVTRPGQPFKILEISSDSPHLSARFEKNEGGPDYLVTATYDGKAPSGELSATLTVKTDDPSQPTVRVPVTGRVR